jgi:hypothetical protein
MYTFISHASAKTKRFRFKDQLFNAVLENWAAIETGDMSKMQIL